MFWTSFPTAKKEKKTFRIPLTFENGSRTKAYFARAGGLLTVYLCSGSTMVALGYCLVASSSYQQGIAPFSFRCSRSLFDPGRSTCTFLLLWLKFECKLHFLSNITKYTPNPFSIVAERLFGCKLHFLSKMIEHTTCIPNPNVYL